ncbi:putative arabinan endo-1,5-alpha-L-arabinosidase A [Cercospora beticola]|uniref:Arabinan endo-1,5-alpha-L-arabinosidase n=1 Tax=Cercospora beticola TaxID=122368 RepID=A0A2G5HNV6_CERBT|nr:putative arabinan endo-1,5-alpha-L-arabinosidase A [Cercospora beticola]PIA94231.1 putative arabinan endo-1,5-alpha-L-arabinosidase A [Cercospora beticola]WPB04557.1 hypothetical protein RHO25_009203 [Cercospora beticola]
MFSKPSILALGAALSTTLHLATAATTYPNPRECTGECVNTHDPSIIRHSDSGTYYKFSTGGTIAIHTSPSISGPWEFACQMLSSASKVHVPGNPGTDLWAPEVTRVGDEYYVYYSVSSFGTQISTIGLATSKDMSCGSWTDLGGTGVESQTGDAYNAIDASLLNDDGVWRMTFGSFWSNIYQVEMESPPTEKVSGSTPKQLAFEPEGEHPEEGPALVKYGDWYYLFFSWGKCCGYDADRPAAGEEYRIKVCRSESASGGFVDNSGKDCTSGGGTVVLESHGNIYGPGGQSVYNDSKDGWLLVYHYVDTTIGFADGQKQFGWNKLDWSSGWPVAS